MKTKKELELEKELTGHFAVDLSDDEPEEINAEIEKDEWIMYPDGGIQKGHGDTHEGGGIGVNIPDGTKIITNSINIGGDLARTLGKNLDLKLEAKDTYAKVMEKYSKKIGLNKAVKEQEEYFTQLKKQGEVNIDEATSVINNEFLSGKINELEAKKNNLNGQMIDIFNTLFDSQEGKKDDNPDKYQIKEGEMKFGGVSHRDLKVVAERMNISYDQALELATGRKKEKPQMLSFRMGGVKKYALGDEKGKEGGRTQDGSYNDKRAFLKEQLVKDKLTKEEYIKENIRLSKDFGMVYNEVADSSINTKVGDLANYLKQFESVTAKDMGLDRMNVKGQHANEKAYSEVGKEGNLEKVFKEMKDQFPTVYKTEFGDKTPAEASEKFDNRKTESVAQVKRLQEGMNSVMEETANYVIKNEGRFSPEHLEFAKNYLEKETFIKPDGDVRSLDGKLGEYTSTRRSLGVDVVTPEEAKGLAEKGIFTIPQLKANKEVFDALSDETKSRITAFGDDAPNFKILEYTPEGEVVPADPKKEDEEDPAIVGDDYIKRQRGSTNTFYPYHIPAAFPLQPQLAQQETLNRIDPLRLRYEEDHQAMREGMRMNARSGMTPQQQLAANAAIISSQQQADASGQMQAVQATAQNYAQADQYNAQVGDKETILNNQLASKYFDETANSMNAKRLNDEERRLNVHNQATKHYDQNRMNAIYAEMFDYNPGYFSTMKFDPEDDWALQQRAMRTKVGIPIDGQYAQPEPDKEKKKKEHNKHKDIKWLKH